MFGKDSKFTDVLSRQPTEKASTEENYDEESVVFILNRLPKSNEKYGQRRNRDQSFWSTDKSKNMVLMTNWRPTKGTSSPKETILDVSWSSFSGDGIQTYKSFSVISNFFDSTNKFDFTDFKIEETFLNEHHHWGANKKIEVLINKKVKSPKTLLLVEKKITNPETFGSNLIAT